MSNPSNPDPSAPVSSGQPPPVPPAVKDLAISIVRDLTGKIVGGVLGAAAAAGVTIPAETSATLTTAVYAVLIVGGQALYYVLVRLAEQRWPGLGRLLGAARAPSYGLELPVHLRAVVDHETTEAEMARVRQDLKRRILDAAKAEPRRRPYRNR